MMDFKERLEQLAQPELFPDADKVARRLLVALAMASLTGMPIGYLAALAVEILRSCREVGEFHGDSASEYATVAIAAMKLQEEVDAA
jgi:hypothetical protein